MRFGLNQSNYIMNRKYLILTISMVLVTGIVLIYLIQGLPSRSVDQEYQISENRDQYLTAATYYGNAWVINFWNSDFSSTDQNMERIKKDGFNTIVLIIPWREFQPGISPPQYNDVAFGRLNYIIEKASLHNLNVILRISYHWDLYPDDQPSSQQRFEDLNLDQGVYQAWLDYVHKIYTNVKGYENVKLAFISWEDFWIPIEEATESQKLSERIKLAKQTGFSDYLSSKYDLDSISNIYGYKINSLENIPTPLRKSPAFALFLEFHDQQLIQKFLKPAQAQYPNLSMEVRVDKDPIYYPNGTIGWYSHSSTYNFTGSNYTTIYYHVSMGAKNNYDYQTANKTLSLMNYTLYHVKNYTGDTKIFVDQFIWYDNTQGFEGNTKIYDNEIGSFLQGACKYLKNYTNGYGVWTYQDYVFNIIYNPTFSLGTSGWQVNGTTRLEQNGINLENGTSVTQMIPKTRFPGIFLNPTGTVSFHARTQTPTADLSIELGGSEFIQHIENDSTYHFKTPIADMKNLNIVFRNLNGSVTISDVRLYSFVQQGDVYDKDSQPKSSLEPIRQLNQCLSDKHN